MIERNFLPHNPTILYIDDDPHNGNLIKRVLEAAGYNVLLASNGSEGLARANQEKPNLILLDIHMPGLNGHEVARRLRQIEHIKNIPILAVSASGTLEDRNRSIKVGCNDYIVKPIDVDLISDQIAAYLV